jgi:glucokinase
MKKRIAIGVDIGGSHVSCSAVDLMFGKIVHGSYFSETVDNQAEADEIIGKWSLCLEQCLSGANMEEVRGIGFAMPGPFDYRNGISLIKGVAKFDALYGLPVIDLIRDALHLPASFPIRFVNDASAFGIGEAWAGSAAGTARVVAITLGTGFGSTFLVNGIPQTTGEDIPENGWVYNIPFQDSIADGCFSTRWFTSKYLKMTGVELNGVAPIAQAAAANPEVKTIFDEFGKNLAEFLNPLLERFRAEKLVIGGNISKCYNLFGTNFTTCLQTLGNTTQIALSSLGDSAAIIGAARLTDDNFYQQLFL